MFKHMQKDGYVTVEALPLLRTSEKLATKVDILQHEVQGLKKAVVQEKKKRKRGRKLDLREEGENPGQARFFSPSRVERARRQAADEAEAERQRKQAIRDRKLEVARARVEKARKKEERKVTRVAAREIAKAEQERKKAERAAKKAAQQASKLAQTTKQPQTTTIEEEEVIVVRASNVGATRPKKRGLEEKGVEVARKRLHAQLSTAHPARSKRSGGCSRFCRSKLQRNTVSRERISSPALRRRGAGWVPVLQRLRSGRSTQPPSRYYHVS